jgi:hypothetical protein
MLMLTLEQIQQEIQDLPEEAQSVRIDLTEILKKRYLLSASNEQSVC